jgi:hypothetical protein
LSVSMYAQRILCVWRVASKPEPVGWRYASTA